MGEWKMKIHGIEVLQPPPDLYVEIMTKRAAHLAHPLRCLLRSQASEDGERVQIFLYGWQDKSGEVWQDLAVVLLRQGVARVSEGHFPERDEYLREERAGVA
jgi:endonuclease YncB( thermonuclease family)